MYILKAITIYGLTATLLVGLTTLVFAQSNIDTAKQTDIMNAMIREMSRDSQKRMMMARWNGNDLYSHAAGLLLENDFWEGIGISQEQVWAIREVIDTGMENDSEYQSLHNELRRSWMSFREAVMSNAPPDVLEKMQNDLLNINAGMRDRKQAKEASLLNEIWTPDQTIRMREFYISTMSEMAFVAPHMFEALDLSDKQREQLDTIKKEMRLELEKHVDNLVNIQIEYEEKFLAIYDELVENLGTIPNQEEQQRLQENTHRRLRAEMQPKWNEIMESGKELADKLKIKMFDVLTDEQWKRVLDLIDNPPDYIKNMRGLMREQRVNVDTPTGVWQPGPGSWRPGDAIPVWYRLERNTRSRFPRGE